MRDVDELAASALWPLGVQADGQPLGRVLAAAATRVLLVEVACVPSGTLLGEVQAYMKVSECVGFTGLCALQGGASVCGRRRCVGFVYANP